MASQLEDLISKIKKQDPNQVTFHQAVEEVLVSLESFFKQYPQYTQQGLLERIVEPERVIIFRVPWVNDVGEVQVNRGYRVQMNSAIGPYKGGLRFHPTVDLDVLKFLAFEQVFKNALTTLPMGGGKGGADFDPKGKSDNEVMRFCQAFMTELSKYIGAFTDVPAGDIGVGAREIGYLFGQYKKIKNEFASVLTGKGLTYGGSLIRTEATGYGLVYFVENMLHTKGQSIEGKSVVISGSGNVAQYALLKLLDKGAKVLTLSDSNGFIYCSKGMTHQHFEQILYLKNVQRGRLSDLTQMGLEGIEYYAQQRPWSIPCDIALPCATQNELNESEAQVLLKNGCYCVAEGANMPSTLGAVKVFLDNKILYGPSKASNAGGVATSGLEMSQNAMRLVWQAEEVDKQLYNIMQQIHHACVENGQEDGYVNYVRGANIVGFKKVADAMLAGGIV